MAAVNFHAVAAVNVLLLQRSKEEKTYTDCLVQAMGFEKGGTRSCSESPCCQAPSWLPRF